ncbi:aldehyde dehydrogenase family protein [Microbacterium sp. UBA3394]|uniref:aldehyde dehydrogenase family protein n=1 Tax=Microbacterium sp. UBA3394 TaxID=1946945 RepID=UPI000C929182|nr:aldehyde dehydrogenase family protein [Microbacterium sp. UBA3394]MAU94275.1 aldehyde dehydrogenase (NADP(+)) [Fulvimarina sp.]|tara:strand:- start:3926 stop:5434 length:1509 start_codon:yes stop_codon:yes gene_type:complete
MSTLTTTDPRTGVSTDSGISTTTTEAIAEYTRDALRAFSDMRRRSRAWRSGLLRALAAGLERDRAALVDAAISETGLTEGRLNTELTRSAFQFRLFADAVDEGGYLEAIIDHAAETPLGPGPDVRRMLVPIGPIAVFGSSNFPFAFSVAGGDTASALAAGNPVLIKAHGSHPVTSRISYESLSTSAHAYGAPEGTLAIVYGQQAGADLVADPHIAAVGFTGSLHTGRILMDIIDQRERPIPFFGELSSVNPLIITPGAARSRGEAIAHGLFASVTGSAGQLCTKPGIAFIPADDEIIVPAFVAAANAADAQPLLNDRIRASFGEIHHRLVADGRARSLVTPSAGAEGFTLTPAVLQIDATDLTEAATEEAFGPLVLVVRYRSLDEIRRALRVIPDSLTATIHSDPSETALAAALTASVHDLVGRVVYNGYPTGVRVSWGMNHGGPWPATNTQHTSVGVTAIRRFLRPFAWQDAPAELLPVELRDDDTSVPRRVDGELRLAVS